ncbi:MAG: ATP-binding cassette domain-containing protein [Candidatus Saccharibacteria bacterium]
MLLSINVTEKSFGDKSLYTDLQFNVQKGEKVGLIGRNGTGKSTLFNLITGADTDYQGEIAINRRAIVVASRQEHHGYEAKTALEYIQGDLPEYASLIHVIDTYPETMGADTRKIQRFTEALDRFNHLGYFQLEDEISQAFDDYQIDPAKMHSHLSDLSGGQVRMIELIKVQRSRGDLALIDEPTNHMDYVAKQAFIKWLNGSKEAMLVVTHDRDVLRAVDQIIEIRDGQAYQFKGNYEQYLSINTNQITAQVNEYDLTQRRMRNLTEDIVRFRRMKEKARDPGTIKRFKSQEIRAGAELARLSGAEKPSFWIDQESAGSLNTKMTSAYEKYKATNIRVTTNAKVSESSRLLVQIDKLSLGYDGQPALFKDVSFSLHEGERVRLHGRNGAGKSTIVNAIVAKARGTKSPSRTLVGHIAVETDLRIGLYEQEISSRYLPMKLAAAIEQVLADADLPVDERKVKQLLGNYLFNPMTDGDMLVERLSGGQKARFQLIRMLINDPQLLILDEPTNHLDLPSIEELENALMGYHGALIYISHDSYFANKLAGETIKIGK